jgi:hypothetical protein
VLVDIVGIGLQGDGRRAFLVVMINAGDRAVVGAVVGAEAGILGFQVQMEMKRRMFVHKKSAFLRSICLLISES